MYELQREKATFTLGICWTLPKPSDGLQWHSNGTTGHVPAELMNLDKYSIIYVMVLLKRSNLSPITNTHRISPCEGPHYETNGLWFSKTFMSQNTKSNEKD